MRNYCKKRVETVFRCTAEHRDDCVFYISEDGLPHCKHVAIVYPNDYLCLNKEARKEAQCQ
jgi:hypothetical protein